MSYPNTICTGCSRCLGYQPTYWNGCELCDICACKPNLHDNTNNNGTQNQHILPSPHNAFNSICNSMSPIYLCINDNFPSLPFHPTQTLNNQMPIVTSNGINDSTNVTSQNTPMLHRNQQPDPSDGDVTESNNTSIN